MGTADQACLAAFRETAQRFAQKELKTRALDFDRYPYAEFNAGVVRAAREVGLSQVLLPEERGGTCQGMEVFSEILFFLAEADASVAAILLINALGQGAILKWGKPSLQEKYLSADLLAFPVYDSPSDLPKGMEAEKKGNGYVLKGKVEYLALAPVAEAAVIPAVLKGTEKIAFFLVDLNNPGISRSAPVLSLGLRGVPAADLETAGLEVPADNLLCPDAGSEYPGLAARFRPAAAALAVGVAAGSYEAAKAYTRERYQAGKIIIDHEMVRLLLSNVAVIAESGRTIFGAMARAVDEGREELLGETGLILSTELASRAVSDGVQALGGYGYIEDYGQEKRMRDAKQIESFFGPAPVKRLELLEGIIRREK
ncbi:MAG: acyl-CoA/acyl-ACP dehydrogenase [bacterium]|nr:acyl-CoA/acyl-ACP dehydrogenase [bacterium]